QQKGYKVQFNSGMVIDPVVVNGFKIDPNVTPASWVVSADGQTTPFENWIGYYVPFTRRAGDALSRFLPGSIRDKYLDYVHTMKTRNWSTCRISEQLGSPWIIDPNTYTLSEGEMVSMKLIPDAPQEMYWNTLPDPVSPIEKPRTTAFSYEEKLDYTSVFIEFDPEDMPSEVGLYVDGQCMGAAVVDSTLIDVCFYAEAAKSGGELEIMFYYEGKGKKAAKGWKLYNSTSMVFEDSALRVDQIGNYAYLSFHRKDGDSLVPLATSLMQNYPNPFNPSTTISFVLAKQTDARLDIYNLRGQKVKTLLSAMMPKGKHQLEWSGRDDHGRGVSSGIYFYRLSTAEGSFTHKMMLMK
ncbi:MAG: T9SS type A sorting domain-containing protein, partial [Candidatus Cloacimonadaceae bacterium]|nr:T9SS type A sorting domain-containing protein [Candidatus Cloacimonadaceae bacterium]